MGRIWSYISALRLGSMLVQVFGMFPEERFYKVASSPTCLFAKSYGVLGVLHNGRVSTRSFAERLHADLVRRTTRPLKRKIGIRATRRSER